MEILGPYSPPGLYGLPVIHMATTSGRWGDDRAPQSRLPGGRTVQLTYQNRPGQTLAAAALSQVVRPIERRIPSEADVSHIKWRQAQDRVVGPGCL